jgi:hypothetical protein
MQFPFKRKKTKPQGFVKYDMANVPSHLQIRLLAIFSVLVLVTGVVLCIATIVQSIAQSESYTEQTNCYLGLQPSYRSCSLPAVYVLPLYISAAVFIAGIVLICVTFALNEKYHIMVRQGEIVEFDDRNNKVCIRYQVQVRSW